MSRITYIIKLHLAVEACKGQTRQLIGPIHKLRSDLNTDTVLRKCTVTHALAYCSAELIMTIKSSGHRAVFKN
jgi:hypothetical protein